MSVYYNVDTKTFIESELSKEVLLNYNYREINIMEIEIGYLENAWCGMTRRLSLLTYQHPSLIDTNVEIITDIYLSNGKYEEYNGKKFYNNLSCRKIDSLEEIINYFEYLKDVVYLSKPGWRELDIDEENMSTVFDILKYGGNLKLRKRYYADMTCAPELIYSLPFITYLCKDDEKYRYDYYLEKCGYMKNKKLKEEANRKKLWDLNWSYCYDNSGLSYDEYIKKHMPKKEKVSSQDIEFIIPLYRLYTFVGNMSWENYLRYGCDQITHGQMCEEYVPFISSLFGLNFLDSSGYIFDDTTMFAKARGELFPVEQRYKEFLNRCKEKNNRNRGNFIDYIFKIRDEKEVLSPNLFQSYNENSSNYKTTLVKTRRKKMNANIINEEK